MEYAQENGICGFSADIVEGNAAVLAVFARGPGHLSSHGSCEGYDIELLFEEPDGVGCTTGGIPPAEY